MSINRLIVTVLIKANNGLVIVIIAFVLAGTVCGALWSRLRNNTVGLYTPKTVK